MRVLTTVLIAFLAICALAPVVESNQVRNLQWNMPSLNVNALLVSLWEPLHFTSCISLCFHCYVVQKWFNAATGGQGPDEAENPSQVC